MRGIKYKAYLKDYKMMVDVEFINLKHKEILAKAEGELFEFQLGEYELVQFTGLHDMNGKEIYEGDILLFNNDYPNAQKMEWKCVVKYLKGSFVCGYPKDGVYNHFDSWNVPKVTWEVIGNIYEHSHLLKEEVK